MLTVPDIDMDADVLTAALSYAAAGWYLVPIKNGTKHPGSLLGDDWQTQSSRDPKMVTAWFAGTSHGVALHVGKSGAVAFDGDHPEYLPGTELLRAIVDLQPPQQRTRAGRCHWLFLQPSGRLVGNGGAGPWGDVRGANGVIVVAPSRHPDPEGGYVWLRTGEVPAMPDYLAATLPDVKAGEAPASSAEVDAFLVEHAGARDPALLDRAIATLTRDLPHETRHPLFTRWAATAMREAAAGLYPAREAYERLWAAFRASEGQGLGRVRSAPEQAQEFDGIACWAIGQALAADPQATQARVDGVTGPALTLNGHDEPRDETPRRDDDELLPGLLREVARLDLRAAAVQFIAERDAAEAWRGFDLGTSAEILARPEDPTARVDGLLGWEGSTLISAQRKAGKTTIALNLARCLVVGAPFLGRSVRVLTGRIVLLNFEVSARQIARWAHDAGVPSDRLTLVNSRGRGNPFASEHALTQLTRALGDDVEALIVDPFGAAFTGDNENDAGQVRRWLSRLEQFAREQVGARDLILTAHAGKAREGGTRGSSALEDWPDTVIRINVDDDQQRTVTAIGRDVELAEHELRYVSLTRTLSLGEPASAARDRRKSTDLVGLAVGLVDDHPGQSGRALYEAAREQHAVRYGDFLAALKQAAAQGLIRVESGGRGTPTLHYPRLT